MPQGETSHRQRAYHIIKTVKYCTPLHLMPFCAKTNSYKSAYKTIDRMLQAMTIKTEADKDIPGSGCLKWHYLGGERSRYYKIYYDPGHHTRKESKAQWEHDFSVIDVACAFANHYGFNLGWTVKILFEENCYFEAGGERKRADALVQMIDNDYKTHNFIIENNNSESPAGIRKEKIAFQLALMKQKLIVPTNLHKKPIEDIAPIDPKKAKFLHISLPKKYTRQTFARSCFTSTKPQDLMSSNADYQIVSPRRKGDENAFNDSLIKSLKELNLPDNFLFLPLHKLPELDQASWKTAKNHSVKLIQ